MHWRGPGIPRSRHSDREPPRSRSFSERMHASRHISIIYAQCIHQALCLEARVKFQGKPLYIDSGARSWSAWPVAIAIDLCIRRAMRQLTSTSHAQTPTSPQALVDGRDAAERKCTHLACAFEHCFQQHKYQMAPACEAKLKQYNECVAEWRAKLHLNAPTPRAQTVDRSSTSTGTST